MFVYRHNIQRDEACTRQPLCYLSQNYISPPKM